MARLNTRQWNLYKYLKERYAENPKAYVTTKEIIRDLPNDYYFTQVEIENHTPAHDTSAHQNIRNDINTIRNSEDVYKIVYSSSKGYKIANEEEANKWLHRVKMEALSKLKMYSKNCKCGSLNQQLRIIFNSEKGQIEVFE